MKKLLLILMVFLSSCTTYKVSLIQPTIGADTIKGKYNIVWVNNRNKVGSFYHDSAYKRLTKINPPK